MIRSIINVTPATTGRKTPADKNNEINDERRIENKEMERKKISMNS